jgi:hypothetical protein
MTDPRTLWRTRIEKLIARLAPGIIATVAAVVIFSILSAETSADTTLPPITVMPPETDIPPGRMLVEGDMLVPLDYYSRSINAPTAPDAFYMPNLWPGGFVPYRFDSSVTAVSQTLALAAMQEWQNIANVRFEACNRCVGRFVTIKHHATRNFADIGRTGNEQSVNINAWNDKFVIVHEFGHTLGLRHEQNRPDRDAYIIINTENIMAGQTGNFITYTDAIPYGPYDFDSVMHYGACFFSIMPMLCANSGGTISATISLRPPYAGTVFGTQSRLTTMDRAIVAQLYPFSNWRFVDVNAAPGGTGYTFFFPYRSFYDGNGNVPAGGTVVIQPGTYDGAAIYTKNQVWWAPIGGVVLR